MMTVLLVKIMNYGAKLLLGCTFLLVSISTFAQLHGHLDESFNQSDTNSLHAPIGTDGMIITCALDSQNRTIIGGNFNEYNSQSAVALARIMPSGQLDTSFNYTNISNLTVRDIAIQEDGRIIIAGQIYADFGSGYIWRNVVRLMPDGALDVSFSGGLASSNEITSVAIDSNEKILVGGNFDLWNGAAAPGLIRMLPDGTVDNTFNIGSGFDSWVMSIVISPSNEIYAGGIFTEFNGTPCPGYLRLLNDGSLDPSFTFANINPTPVALRHLALQSNGQLIAGNLDHVYRFNLDGTADVNFSIPEVTSSGNIITISVLNNNKILVGGSYTSLNNSSGSPYITMLNPDGSIDSNFDPLFSGSTPDLVDIAFNDSNVATIVGDFNEVNGIPFGNIVRLDEAGETGLENHGFNHIATCNYVLENGKIIIGGAFENYNNVNANRLACLQPNGDIDSSFATNIGDGIPGGSVWSVYEQMDGKILVGGNFNLFDTNSVSNLVRVNADGTYDPTFVGPQFNGSIKSITQQGDGKILVAGGFTNVGGTSMFYIVRLNTDGSMDNTFSSPLSNNVTFSYTAEEVAIASDGKILVAGRFSCCESILKLNSDGSIDNNFNYYSSSTTIYDFAEMDNGNIFVVGNFWNNGGGLCQRLESDGTLIENLDSQFSGSAIYAIERTQMNDVIVGGVMGFQLPHHRPVALFTSTGARVNEFDVNEEIFSGNVGGFVWDLAVQHDGKVIVSGDCNNVGGRMVNFNFRLHKTQGTYYETCDDSSPITLNQITIDPPVSGLYIDTVSATTGLDSLVNIFVIVDPTHMQTLTDLGNLDICADSAIVFGQWVTSDGYYYDTLQNIQGCDSIISIDINLQQPPPISFNDTTFINLCDGSNPYQLPNVTPQFGIYSGTGVIGNFFDPNVSGLGTHQAIYSYAYGNGCITQDSITFNVTAPPNVQLPLLDSACIADSPFILSSGSPSGGNYSGNGVSNNVFDPFVVGIGGSLITYSYMDANGCENEALGLIEVVDCTVGLTEQNLDAPIIFPNPADKSFEISASSTIHKVTIIDELGKIILSSAPISKEHACNVEQLAQGIYIVTIYTENGVYNNRLVIE